ncbi:MAG: T9SS type A sorting domain-containing protein [Ignavibacterium sp.]|jgi:hypothetical protein|nr:T9SS type A sorting domain-containing protein [Ignavibacterium sp.]
MRTIFLFFILTILLVNINNFAVTKTWNGGTGTGLNWTTPGNWLPAGQPVAGDDIVFNTAGTIAFSTLPTANIAYNSLSILQGAITLAGTTRLFTLGGNAGTDFTIAIGAALTLTNVNITLAANATADISGILTINSGRTFTAGGAGAIVNIAGTVTNIGTYNASTTSAVTNVTGMFNNNGSILNSSTARLNFSSNGTYQHSRNGGTIPTATWNVNSNCLITGITANLPTAGFNQSFGHLTWNCPLQSQNGQINDAIRTKGNLTLIQTGTGALTTRNDRANTVDGDYIQSGGTFNLGNNNTHSLTVSGNFSLSSGSFNNTGDNSPGGVLNVAGNFSITGGTLAGGNLLNVYFNGSVTQMFQSGGSVTGTTNFTVNSGATLQMDVEGTVVSGTSFTLLNGATLGIRSASGITSIGASGNIRVTGTRTFNTGANYIYNGTSPQSIGSGFPNNLTGTLTIDNAGNTVTLDNSRTIANTGSINLFAGTFAVQNNLAMATTSSINRSEGSMTGTLQGAGTYNVTFTGNSKPTRSELSGTGLNNVTINLNSAQSLDLDQDRSVRGTLTMTSGNIITGTNTLTLGTDTGVLGLLSHTSGTIIGNFRRWFNNTTVSDVLFPIGTDANYRPANISFTTAPTTGGTLTAFFTASDPGTTGLPLDDAGTQIINAGVDGYWKINATLLTGGTYSLDLIADGFTNVSVVNTLRILKRPTGGGNWTLQGSHLAGTGTLSTPVVRRTGMSGFSEFGIGGASDNALPVELSSFSASVVGNAVKLNWRTETEVNNYGFEVERKSNVNGQTSNEWTKLGFVNGSGNSNSPKSYYYEDKNVSAGKYSYRLKQIDNDGQFEYSKTIEVDLGAPKKFELSQNYPNPFNPTTTIRFSLPEASTVKLTVFNILGQEIKTLVNEFKESGVHTINFDASELNSGIYIYKIEAGTYTQSRKMMLVK